MRQRSSEYWIDNYSWPMRIYTDFDYSNSVEFVTRSLLLKEICQSSKLNSSTVVISDEETHKYCRYLYRI
jgi:hypothetical protein